MNKLKCSLTGLVCASLCGCGWLEDNGVHMGYCLKDGAKEPARSTNTELVVRHEPWGGMRQIYDVEFNPDSVLLIGGKREDTTTIHLRYVHVGRQFALIKTSEPTFVTLRKVGNRIDVVGVRQAGWQRGNGLLPWLRRRGVRKLIILRKVVSGKCREKPERQSGVSRRDSR